MCRRVSRRRDGWELGPRPRRVRAGRAVVVACAMMGIFSAGARAEGLCPNEALRAEQPYGVTLPDCRAYQLVSPAYTDGAPAHLLAVSPDGSRMIVQSVGNFGDAKGSAENEGSTYELTRTETGWSETGIDLHSRSSHSRSSTQRAKRWNGHCGRRAKAHNRSESWVSYPRSRWARASLGPTKNPEGTSKGLPGLGDPLGFSGPPTCRVRATSPMFSFARVRKIRRKRRTRTLSVAGRHDCAYYRPS